jgi:catechol 1,2-dioxygenase
MIIKTEKDLTPAVLSELQRAKEKHPRFVEIMSAAVRHLHEFAREVKLTEEEFHQAAAYILALGQKSNATHNEVVLMAGSLGLSPLICLLNNGNKGQTETSANMLGPFWRTDSPKTKNGDSIVRSPTPGPVLFVDAHIKDADGKPVEGAEIDVWQSSTDGYYENQDPDQADMNLRGKFTSDNNGYFGFRSIKPAGYPIPVDGPTGDLIRIQGRHNMRPAHLHVLIYKQGYKTHISQVYSNDDPNLDSDVQFGVTEALVGNYVRHDTDKSPDVKAPWYSLEYTFVVEKGVAKLPKAPISAKATERAELEVLERV